MMVIVYKMGGKTKGFEVLGVSGVYSTLWMKSSYGSFDKQICMNYQLGRYWLKEE